MVDNRDTLNITGGMDVFGSDGEKVGSVAGVEGDYVVVSKGFFFPTDYYIPTSAINSADDDGVYLNVTKDEALNQGWDTAPETTSYVEGDTVDSGTYGTDQVVAGQGTLGTTYDDTTAGEYRADDESLVDRARDAVTPDTDRTTYDDTDNEKIQLSEEQLVAQTRDVERGAVRLDKVVTEEDQTVEVPVTEERVRIDRRPVDGDVTSGEATFEEGTIEVPVRGQEVEVGKQSRVVEEVDISKDRVQDTERVTDTVRREDVRVQDETGTLVDEAETRNRNDR
jgi:uncharacterized protein (TIGR02271 family)